MLGILNKYWDLFKPAPGAEKPTKEAMQSAIAFTIGQLFITKPIESIYKIIFQFSRHVYNNRIDLFLFPTKIYKSIFWLSTSAEGWLNGKNR